MPQLEQIATYPSQVFWLVVTFVALFLIMWRVAVPRISDALEARQQPKAWALPPAFSSRRCIMRGCRA